MDLMLRDNNFKKVEVIRRPEFVCNTGLFGATTNDFKLVLSETVPFPIGHMITYGTSEFGGVIADRITNTKEKTITYIGKSFRGQLENSIVSPFSVLTLTGTDYELIKQIISLSQVEYKVNPTGHTEEKTIVLPMGTNALRAIDLVMNAFDERIAIKVSNDGVEVSISGTVEFKYDASSFDLVVDENRMLPTALHAKSKEYSISVYLQADGTVGLDRYYKGFEAMEIMQEINANSLEELTSLASDKLLALRNSQNTSEVDAKIEDAEIGDKIAVTVKKYGINAYQTVSEKILNFDGKNEEIKTNTGG